MKIGKLFLKANTCKGAILNINTVKMVIKVNPEGMFLSNLTVNKRSCRPEIDYQSTY